MAYMMTDGTGRDERAMQRLASLAGELQSVIPQFKARGVVVAQCPMAARIAALESMVTRKEQGR